jgi:hypothetical protein
MEQKREKCGGKNMSEEETKFKMQNGLSASIVELEDPSATRVVKACLAQLGTLIALLKKGGKKGWIKKPLKCEKKAKMKDSISKHELV